jgi:hypothetical protein
MWAKVAEWRDRLLEQGWQNIPAIASLEEAWGVLDEHYGGVVKRANQERVAMTPAEALFFHVEMGFYPPPEILLAVHDSYLTYLQGRGALTIEETLFGKPPRKGGNLAKRRATLSRYIHWGVHIQHLREEGLTLVAAAEKVAKEFPDAPEPESMVRLISANYPFILRKKKAR